MVALPWLEQQQPDRLTQLSNFFGGFAENVYPNLKGVNTRKSRSIADELAQLVRAQYDTDSPVYQKSYQQQRQRGQQNIADVIAEASRQNRKLSSLGRTPLFDAERGGEVQFRNLIRGYQDSDANAHDETLRMLARSINGQQSLLNAEQEFAAVDAANRKKKGSALGSLASAIPILGGLFR